VIVARTPLRISLLGGGSDLPGYYSAKDGQVLSFAINKYVYVAVHSFFQGGFRISYSETENTSSIQEIKHPLIRESLSLLKCHIPLEISSFADIPGNGSGLGSSSAFTVSTLNAVSRFMGNQLNAKQLAEYTCKIEIEKCGSPIGKQDQYAVSFGGLNRIFFKRDQSVLVQPCNVLADANYFISQNFLLVHTKISRSAGQILGSQQQILKENLEIQNLYSEAINLIPDMLAAIKRGSIEEVASILSYGWELKKKFSPDISNDRVDELFKLCMQRGALGGKLLGAGGGGFLLICVHPEQKEKFLSMSDLRVLEIAFEPKGSEIVFNDQQ